METAMEERVLHWPLSPEDRLTPRLRWWPGSMLAAFLFLTISFFVLIEFPVVRPVLITDNCCCTVDFRVWGWVPTGPQFEDLQHLQKLGAPVFFPWRSTGGFCAAPPYVP
jgi:hypothetical protein